MLGMLRRARERREARERNCACNQTCDCHKPESGVSQPWAWFIILSPLILMVLLGLFGARPTPQVRTIHVGKQICEVVFVKTGETCEDRLLHHECKDEGYDKAVSCR